MRVATAQDVNYGIRDPRNLSPKLLLQTAIILAVVWGSAILTARTSYPGLTWLRVAISGLVLLGTLIIPRAPRDFFGGLALIALGLVAIWASSELSGMHGFAFGPGTAPRLFASVLIFLAASVALTGVLLPGPAIEQYAIRGPVLVVLAIVFFAVTIRPLGLILAAYCTFVIAISASREVRWIEALIAAAAMTAFCVLLFSYLLQLPFQLKPAFML